MGARTTTVFRLSEVVDGVADTFGGLSGTVAGLSETVGCEFTVVLVGVDGNTAATFVCVETGACTEDSSVLPAIISTTMW